MADFDVFLSYAHADRERVLVLRDALVAQGVAVWLDESGIETFESISATVERGLARSRALVAFYSRAFPARRACQWELTAAFLAAQRAGYDPRGRVLVVNPERDAEHVLPVELQDALYAHAPDDREGHCALAQRIAAHVGGLHGALGDLGVSVRPSWFGRRPVSAARFVGRLREMWAVHSALVAGEVGLITGARGDPAVQVAGMGGIGKSLLAQEYALRFAAAYPGGVFWLRAHGHDDTAETLSAQALDAERNTQLLAFARDVGLDAARLSPEEVPGALARILDDRAEPFLWIVDDLPGDLENAVIKRWLAPGRYGRTLLTTRSRAYEAIGTQINLGVLSALEGLELLAKHRVPAGPGEEAAARGLVDDLGRHALALDVAGAALKAEQGARSFAAYRGALADPGEDELELAASFAGELPGGHEASIATTLARSIRSLDDPGLDFLRLASRLGVDPIVADLVVEVFALTDGLDETAARRRAVKAMHDSAIRSLSETTDDGARQVHPLVSRTIRSLDRTPSRTDALADAATTTLTRRLRASYAVGVSENAVTLAHARQLAGPLRDEHHAALLNQVALNDYIRGDYRSARRLQEQLLAMCRQVLGDEHPDTLTAMNDLAMTVEAQGELTDALTLHDWVFGVYRRVLGEEHPNTLRSIGNLAGTLRALGDLVGARTLQERVLDGRRRILGGEHPHTLTSMSNLAVTLKALGDLAGARALQEEELEASRRILGDEHPETLRSVGNLAVTLKALGDLAGARALQEQVLDELRRVLGDDHPDTLTSMNNLAMTLKAQGDLAGARTLHERALGCSRRILGDEHPETLASMSNVAGTLEAQGDLAGARALQEQVLDTQRRVLGLEHPDTLTFMNNLAGTLRTQGDLAGARALQEEVFNARRRILGDEHPETLGSMNNLALTLVAQGDLARARALLERVLDAHRRLLGAEHPSTLTSMNNLAGTLEAQGDLAGARALQEQVLDTQRRVLGLEHPDTLGSMNNLALTLKRQGDLAGARTLHERALGCYRRILGAEHPDTLASMSNLAGTLEAQGDLAGARALQEQVLDTQRRALGLEHPSTLGSMNNLALTLEAQGDLAGARTLLEQTLEALRRVLGAEHPDTLRVERTLADMPEEFGRSGKSATKARRQWRRRRASQ